MSPATLNTLAAWHDAKAVSLILIAEYLCVPASDRFVLDATQHGTWAAQLRALAATIEGGLLGAASVIEAGDHERRSLLATVAKLERDLSVVVAPESVVLSASQAIRLKQMIAAAAVDGEAAAGIFSLLEGKATA